MKYGQRINWTSFDGMEHSVEVIGNENESIFDVRKKTMEIAIKSGWTYPKWYQIWRWNDTKVSLDELLFKNIK